MLGSAEEPTEGSQSVRSSEETGNDRGAKGRRKVETRRNQQPKTNRRQWKGRGKPGSFLNKPETLPTDGRGWNGVCGPSVC